MLSATFFVSEAVISWHFRSWTSPSTRTVPSLLWVMSCVLQSTAVHSFCTPLAGALVTYPYSDLQGECLVLVSMDLDVSFSGESRSLKSLISSS